MEAEYVISNNELINKFKVHHGSRGEQLFTFYYNDKSIITINIYEMLISIFNVINQDDDNGFKQLYNTIIAIDSLAIANPYYWDLRYSLMVDYVFSKEKRKRVKKYSKCKTYLMKDNNTGFIKIGKSIHPKKREYTLQSEKPTISLFMVCDKLVEREIHKHFAHKHVRGEWYNLAEDDIKYLIDNYNFYNIQ